MKPYHWTSLGVASTMVTVLVGAALLMPTPKGTARAQASFPIPEELLHPRAALAQAPMQTYAQARTLRPEPSAAATPVRKKKHLPAALGYDLDAVLKGYGEVPRLTLASVPDGLADIRETNERKAAFFKTVLPLVLQVNERILADRQRLRDIGADRRAGKPLAAGDRQWLAVMAERYGTRRGDVDALLANHDIVPPSLALAQAATESAWGTSRFVQEGNAIFGQRTFAQSHSGIVPSAREDGLTHRVRAFDTPLASVESYVINLNTHPAYAEFRAVRAGMRQKGQPLDGMRLAATLDKYSERGADYVADLHTIMSGNDLTLLDRARLSGDGRYEPVI